MSNLRWRFRKIVWPFSKYLNFIFNLFLLLILWKGYAWLFLRSVCGARLPPPRDHEDQFPKSLVRLHFCPRQGHLGNEAFLCPGIKAFRIVTKGQLISKGLFGILEFFQKRTNELGFSTVRQNKNECEIHSKVIVSQDYFDYWVRV